MAVEYQEIRAELEADGFRLDDEEYTEAVNYARRKAKSSGKDESYMPYLLPDVIREWIIRKAINSVTIAAMEIEKNIQTGGKRAWHKQQRKTGWTASRKDC